MKPIQETIKNLQLSDSQKNLTRSEQKTFQKTALPIHWVTELFKVFQSRYFSKWTRPIEGIEERAVKEWSEGLSGLSGKDIKRGLDDWSGDWPPCLDEFKSCCLGGDLNDRWEHKGAAYRNDSEKKCLPIKKAQKDIANAERDKLKKMGILK